ncbi:Uncharacterized protein dnm_032650 [Desulfonema magnum]|uniref:Uncharacterized protein n=1 Tax=Desulfonema magnum TaxID=45655 RepID=A0A975BLC6_9BACT|nr:Uncharacterized protein dnm_032650 [Desulfonema magnum]
MQDCLIAKEKNREIKTVLLKPEKKRIITNEVICYRKYFPIP